MSRAVQTFGRPVRRSQQAPITTRDPAAYPSWQRPLPERYIQTLVTNTFGNTFYVSAKDLLAESEQIHGEMLAADPIFAAKALAYARNHGYMRTQPIYGLVRLLETNGELFESVFPQVIRTPNDLRDFTVMLMARRRAAGKKSVGGRRIKRTVGQWIASRMSEYWAVKYGSEGKVGFALRDMLRVYHPETSQRSPLLDWIMGERKMNVDGKSVVYTPPTDDLKALPQVAAFERLKAAKTDAEKIEAIIAGRLPHEVASSFAGKSATVWKAIAGQMPIFAMLRHLATLERHGVMDAVEKIVVQKLTDKATVQRSKILPFRFATALEHVQSAKVRDALRDAVDIAFENVPALDGRTAVFLDISGSMGGYIRTAALFAVCLMRKADLNGRVLLFDTMLEEFKVSKRDSMLSQAAKVEVRGGTNTALPMQYLLKERDKVDQIILVTDEQQNNGSPFIDVLDEYRRKVNKNVKTFVVDVAPYQTALTPNDPNTWYMFGWSDVVLKFIAQATKGWGTMVEAIKSGTVDKPVGEDEEEPAPSGEEAPAE